MEAGKPSPWGVIASRSTLDTWSNPPKVKRQGKRPRPAPESGGAHVPRLFLREPEALSYWLEIT